MKETSRAEPPVETMEATPLGAVTLEDDTPSFWPDAAAEEMYLVEQKSQNRTPPPPPADAPEETVEPSSPLPALDDLVKQIPVPVRETLDELFRAKFVKVQRVPKSALRG
ncbi:MAG TPA: hypothetical protein PLF88_07495 [Opitutaceae bacterium]|nr:hypothetical protein [Opitutaceae bacterium]HRJ46791.1 hypothetical protein [Opitutaceae bacterium]